MNNLSLNYEWYNILNSNFLMIHKNASCSIRQNFNLTRIEKPNSDHINWTVIRKPIERFKSGLAYDIKYNGYVNIPYLSENPEKLLYGEHNQLLKSVGHTSHTYMQSLNFLNEKIDMFVRIEDLNDFIRIHNGEYIDENENKNGEEETEIASKIINNIGKQRLDDLFYIENQIYNRIVNSQLVWKWQNGDILSSWKEFRDYKMNNNDNTI